MNKQEILNILYKHNVDIEKVVAIEICTQNGKSWQENLKNEMYGIWNNEKIKNAFKLGNGTFADLKNHIENNKKLAKFIIL